MLVPHKRQIVPTKQLVKLSRLDKFIYISLTLSDLFATGNHELDNYKLITKRPCSINFPMNNGKRIFEIEITTEHIF